MHNFKYTLKTIFKNKALIFWTFAFPLILATFFNMAFSDIEESEKLKIIDIAIINDNSFNNNLTLKEGFKALSNKDSEEQLFNITYVDCEEEAKSLLEKDSISGYIKIDNEPIVVVKSNGINETIIKHVTDLLLAQEKISIIFSSVEGMYGLKEENTNTNIKDVSRSNLSYTIIEYYSLIAMTCLYGGIIGMYSINRTLPNMNSVGKRIGVSPEKKGSIILGSAIASFIVELIGLLLLFLYTIFVLKIDYGSNVFFIIILSCVGSFTGLSLGIFVASIFKTNENNKLGIIIAVTMFGCFLSGMMGITMKYVIDKNIPIINKLNPAAIITDGFYALYYYDTLDRYIFNVVSLIIISIIFLLISTVALRRNKYDNI